MKFLIVKEGLVPVLSKWPVVGVRSVSYLDSIGYLLKMIKNCT